MPLRTSNGFVLLSECVGFLAAQCSTIDRIAFAIASLRSQTSASHASQRPCDIAVMSSRWNAGDAICTVCGLTPSDRGVNLPIVHLIIGTGHLIFWERDDLIGKE
jgi:hypothetical protein